MHPGGAGAARAGREDVPLDERAPPAVPPPLGMAQQIRKKLLQARGPPFPFYTWFKPI